MSPAPLHPRTLHRLGPGLHRDSVRPGLLLRVTPGAAVFYVEYKARAGAGWATRRYRLGSAGKLSLADARAQAKDVLVQVAQGRDPHAERQAERRRPAGLTVGELAHRMLAGNPLEPRTRREWERVVAHDLAPLLALPAAEVRRADVRALLAGIAGRAPVQANRALQILRRAYTWGMEQDLVEAWPGAGLKAAPEAARARVLTAEEVGALWRALVPGDQHDDAVALLLLTGVRRNVALGARREEVDVPGRLWRVPAARMKAGRDHLVPLSGPALEVLDRRLATAPGACLFPQSVQPTGRGAAREVRDRPQLWLSSRQEALRARVALEVAQARGLEVERLPDGAPALGPLLELLPRWTLHDLRRTLATHAREDLGAGRDVVAMLLAHEQGGPAATRIYDRAELLAERRAVLVAWAAWVLRQAEGGGAKVLPMRRA